MRESSGVLAEMRETYCMEIRYPYRPSWRFALGGLVLWSLALPTFFLSVQRFDIAHYSLPLSLKPTHSWFLLGISIIGFVTHGILCLNRWVSSLEIVVRTQEISLPKRMWGNATVVIEFKNVRAIRIEKTAGANFLYIDHKTSKTQVVKQTHMPSNEKFIELAKVVVAGVTIANPSAKLPGVKSRN